MFFPPYIKHMVYDSPALLVFLHMCIAKCTEQFPQQKHSLTLRFNASPCVIADRKYVSDIGWRTAVVQEIAVDYFCKNTVIACPDFDELFAWDCALPPFDSNGAKTTMTPYTISIFPYTAWLINRTQS